MTLGDLWREARAGYGLEDSVTEDATLANSFLTKLVNKEIAYCAGITKAFSKPDLSITPVNGTMEYTLGANVIELDRLSVRIKLTGASTYTRLYSREMRSLLHQYTALEDVAASATVLYYYLRGGDAAAAPKKIGLVPKPNNGGTLLYGAIITPAALTVTGDTVPFQEDECYLLVPGINLRMAEWEQTRHRPDAPVDRWAAEARIARAELARRHGQSLWDPPRAAEVATPSGVGADERRRSAPAGG